MQNRLDVAAFEKALETTHLARRVYYFEQIDSTNSYARRMLNQLQSGSLIVTDYQSQGRGRHARRWVAPPNSCLLQTLVLRPRLPVERLAWLMMISALAMIDAVEQQTAVQLAIKWPNDLMAGSSQNGWRKVGGILLVSESDGTQRPAAIVGQGLNVNVPQHALPEAATPAGSLLIEHGSVVAREPLLAAYCFHFEQRLQAAEAGRSPHADWHARLIQIGRQVTVHVHQAHALPPISGIAESTDSWGRLLVRDAQGRSHAVAAGDVTLRDA